MKKFFICVVCLAVFCAIPGRADPVEGLWKSVDEKTGKVTGAWKIEVKNNLLFGEMLVAIDREPRGAVTACKNSYPDFPKKGTVSNMPLVGTPFIYNLKQKSEGVWHKGYIIDPGSGKYYYCKITFRKADGKKYKSDMLEMRGEIGIGIGRSQYWIKTTQEEVDQLIANNVVKHDFVLATE
ncbi:MAG: DUF2147 domain-containing protein [Treponema sp.]